MANTVVLWDKLDTIGIFDSTVSYPTAIRVPSDRSLVRIQCSSIQMSSRIPNIFDGTAMGIKFDNTKLRVGTDTAGYVGIAMDPGIYQTTTEIEAAINSAINTLGWWSDPLDPGLKIITNTVIDKINIIIDSTKLAPAFGTQFILDLREVVSGSKLWKTLGFDSTTLLTVDGTHTSGNVPQMDTQGTTAVVCCSAMPARFVNNVYRPLVANVSFAGALTASDILWPPGGVVSTVLPYNGPSSINNINFYVLTSDGTPMVFLDGQLLIELAFYY